MIVIEIEGNMFQIEDGVWNGQNLRLLKLIVSISNAYALTEDSPSNDSQDFYAAKKVVENLNNEYGFNCSVVSVEEEPEEATPERVY